MKRKKALFVRFFPSIIFVSSCISSVDVNAQNYRQESPINHNPDPYTSSYSSSPYVYGPSQTQGYTQYPTTNAFQSYYQTQSPLYYQDSYQSRYIPRQAQPYPQYTTMNPYSTTNGVNNNSRVFHGRINTSSAVELRNAEQQRLSNTDYYQQQLQNQVDYQETSQPYTMRNQQYEGGMQDRQTNLQRPLNIQQNQMDQFQERQNNQQHIMHGYTQPQTYPQYYPTNPR